MKKVQVILAGFLAIVMMSACFGGNSSSNNSAVNNNGSNNNNFDINSNVFPQEETQPDDGYFDNAPMSPASVQELDLNDYVPTVTKVGSIAYDPNLKVSASILVNSVKNGSLTELTLLSYEGKSLLSQKYHNYEYFGDGITAAYYYSEEIPQCSLVNINTGKVYLADNACKIEQLSDRFYRVIYTTEKTTDKAEAFIYFTDSMFSFAPQEGDILYKGYAKIFDIQTGNFVGNYMMEKPTDVFVCGEESLLVKIDWSTSDIYAADGTLLADDIEDVTVCQNYFVQSSRDGTTIYDSSFNPIRKIAAGDPIEEDGEKNNVYSEKYLSYDDYDLHKDGVMDFGGNVMTEPAFEMVYNTFHDYIFVSKEINGQDYHGVCLADGTEIIPFQFKGAYGHDTLPLIQCYDHNYVNYKYVPGYGLIDLSDYKSTGEVHYKRPNENDYTTCSYLVYATGQLVTYKNASVIMDRLLVCEDGLLDLLTGKTLLSAQELKDTQVMATDEYIYAYSAATRQIAIYKVEVK